MPATHIPISTRFPSFPQITTDTTPSPYMNDLPPPYTPYNPPSYTLSDRIADRGNYAFAIMQHNLRYNHERQPEEGSRSPSPPLTTGTPPSPTPEPIPTPTPEVQPPRTTRAQEAALRDFQASQNPDLWGRRVGHGRHARLIRDENQGFWSWLGELLIDEERARGVALSARSPWGFIAVTGHV